jgi:hypothetical protein
MKTKELIQRLRICHRNPPDRMAIKFRTNLEGGLF